MYLVNQNIFLPASKVHVPCKPEHFPSSQQGTCTLLTRRFSFQPVRYMYLFNWNETLPASEVVPCQPFKGRIYVDTCQWMWISDSAEKASRYPDAPLGH
jgi:hypothetical protein